MLAANARLAPGYAKGLAGVARSMPTSAASRSRRRQARHRPFRDADRLEVLRQSARRRAGDALRRGEFWHRLNHIREKDGLWAVLLWLNILAKRRISVADLAREHWRTYGRNYYTRHDFDEIDHAAADGLMNALRAKFATPAGPDLRRADRRGRRRLRLPHDPVDGSNTEAQGITPVMFPAAPRIVYRLSPTEVRSGRPCGSTSSATSRRKAISARTRRRCSPTSSRCRARWRRSRRGPDGRRRAW